VPSKKTSKKGDEQSSETASNCLAINREILLCLRPIRDGEQIEGNLRLKPERKNLAKGVVSEDTKSSAISGSEDVSFSHGISKASGDHSELAAASVSRKRPGSANGSQPKKAKL
jgi:hypothetical protein